MIRAHSHCLSYKHFVWKKCHALSFIYISSQSAVGNLISLLFGVQFLFLAFLINSYHIDQNLNLGYTINHIYVAEWTNTSGIYDWKLLTRVGFKHTGNWFWSDSLSNWQLLHLPKLIISEKKHFLETQYTGHIIW